MGAGHPGQVQMTSPHAPEPAAIRAALVTGAASGIGLATARRLLQAGMTVVLVDRVAEVAGVAAMTIEDTLLPRAFGFAVRAGAPRRSQANSRTARLRRTDSAASGRNRA